MSRHVFSYVRAIVVALLLFAPLLDVRAQRDSTTFEEYESVHHWPVTPADGCWLRSRGAVVIDDARALAEATRSEGCLPDSVVDFSRQTLLVVSIFADCNARVAVRVIRNERDKIYRCLIEEEYGGCRGMRTLERWITVEKIPPDYRVIFTSIRID